MAQKVGAVETAADFFRRRAGGRSADELAAILAKIPMREAEPGDELPGA